MLSLPILYQLRTIVSCDDVMMGKIYSSEESVLFTGTVGTQFSVGNIGDNSEYEIMVEAEFR